MNCGFCVVIGNAEALIGDGGFFKISCHKETLRGVGDFDRLSKVGAESTVWPGVHGIN